MDHTNGVQMRTRIAERDAAVSPVVGVMLMLSLTVMIAAIVSAAAGGLSGTEKKAPSAILDVTFYAVKRLWRIFASLADNQAHQRKCSSNKRPPDHPVLSFSLRSYCQGKPLRPVCCLR